MRYAEIVPKNGSHYVIVDGKEWSRHNDVKTAEKVREQLLVQGIQEVTRRRSIFMDHDYAYRQATMDQSQERGLVVDRDY